MRPSLAAVDDEIGEWLAAARRGEERGFTGLYRLLSPKVAGYLAGRGVDEVDDVTNEVFLGAFRNLSTFDGDAPSFRSWLFGIAWNKSADWHRTAARRPPVADSADVHGARFDGSYAHANAEAEVLERMSTEGVDAMLANLTDDQRDVLMLRILADLSLEQVAEALDKPIGAVKSLQHRGLLALKRTVFSQPVSPLS